MRKLLAFVSLAALVVVLGACSGGEGDAMSSFSTDDMCSWVSEDEVAEFVAAEFEAEPVAEHVLEELGWLPDR